MILFWLTIAMSPESRQWSEPEYRRDAKRKILEYKTRKKIFRRIFLITIGERHWTNDCWNRTDRCTDVRIHCISMGSNPSEILCGGSTGFGSDMRCYSGYTCTCVVVGSMAQMTRGCDTLPGWTAGPRARTWAGSAICSSPAACSRSRAPGAGG